jgi:ABC-type uncharacterized transport system substrate-binding protein
VIRSFRSRLAQLGWTDGVNLWIDYRWTAGVADQFRTAAAELVALKPDVILADASPSVAALRRETATTPIVFTMVNDPVAQDFVASLARPGGNLTGFQWQELAIGGKWLSLLKDAAPHITRVALMFNPTTAPTRTLARSAADIDAAFAREPNGGLMMRRHAI